MEGLESIIKIQNDSVTKTIIQANHGNWKDSLKTDTPICLSIADNTYEDIRMCSELTVDKLEELANSMLEIVYALREEIKNIK